MTTATTDRLLYSIQELHQATGVSESTIRRCIRAEKSHTDRGWPPLTAKRRPDGQLVITAEAAAAWIAALPDA